MEARKEPFSLPLLGMLPVWEATLPLADFTALADVAVRVSCCSGGCASPRFRLLVGDCCPKAPVEHLSRTGSGSSSLSSSSSAPSANSSSALFLLCLVGDKKFKHQHVLESLNHSSPKQPSLCEQLS